MSTLEEKCEESQLTIDELTAEKSRRQERVQRTYSVPSLPCDGSGDHDGLINCERFDQQIIQKEEQRRRNDTIRQLKQQLQTETKRRCELEKELNVLEEENQDQAADREAYEERSQRVLELERDLETAQLNSELLCNDCGRKTTDATGNDSGALLEHDLKDLRDIPHGRMLRLKNGGSAYGSRESLNLIGLETEDGIGEVCAYLINAKRSPDSPLSPGNDDVDETGVGNLDSVSILGELEEQYRKLVMKYESLIDVKNKARSSRDVEVAPNPEPTPAAKPRNLDVQTSAQTSCWNLDLRSPIDPTDHHFENGPPEYKRLFKEIFDTLRRSVDFEEGLAANPSHTDSSPA